MMCQIRLAGEWTHANVLSFLVFLATIILVTHTPSTLARLGPHHPGGPVRAIHTSHHHHVPTKSEDGQTTKITADMRLLHDKEHMKEDLGEWAFADGKDMTPEEMEFYYFRMHDFDNNTQLDGLEILQALMHVLPIDEIEHESDNNSPNANGHGHGPGHKPLSVNYESHRKPTLHEEDFNYYIDLIDTVFEQDDLNRDGMLSYPEYVIGRRKMDAKDGPSRGSLF